MKKTSLSIAVLALMAAGCSTINTTSEADTELARKVQNSADNLERLPVHTVSSPRVLETPGAYIPVTERKVSSSLWLKNLPVKLTMGNQPVTLAEVLRSLSRQGVNVVSELPLDRFTYAGYSMNDVDAETALRMILGSTGLDYSADNERKI